MLTDLRRGLLYTVVTMALFGGAYHVLLWGIGAAVFPAQAEGSLLRRADGTVVGSALIAQAFTRAEYFHPRPSAVGYDAASAGGSNYGPSNPDHVKAVRERLDAMMQREGVAAAQVPSEMVTASGSGLDPHIPPTAAEVQLARVARARGVDAVKVRALVRANTDEPWLGFYGRPGVNVLELNVALDEAFGAPPAAPAE